MNSLYEEDMNFFLSYNDSIFNVSWAAAPACTELETVVLDWLGSMVGLPTSFLSTSETSKELS